MEISFLRFNRIKSVSMCQSTEHDTVVTEISSSISTQERKRRKSGKIAFAREIIFVRKNFFAQMSIFEKNVICM